MVELLFIIAMGAWAVISLILFLAALPAAPALLAATLMLPGLTWLALRRLARRGNIPTAAHRTGAPLPPERFYWPATRRRLGWRTVLMAAAAGALWVSVFLWPARLSLEIASLARWIPATLAIVALAESVGAGWLYVRASQHFNRQTPSLIGWMRRALYRLSDNHEFLREEPLPREKRVREAVY